MKTENNPLSPTELKPEIFSCISNILQVYKCQSCLFESELSVVLHNHTTVIHKKRKILNEMLRKYYCENCDFQTWSLLVLTKHFTQCRGSDNAEWLNCALCTYKTRWKFELRNHVFEEHSDQEDSDWLECEQCSTEPLSEHVHNTKRFEWVKCGHCPFKTISSSGLKVHMSHCHEESEDFQWAECDHCSFKTKWDSNLKRHMKNIHKKDEIEWFSCYKCPIRLAQKHRLAAHIIAEHINVQKTAGLLWFKCERCSYKTTSDESLKIHITCHLSSANPNKQKRSYNKRTADTCLTPQITDRSSVNHSNEDKGNLRNHILAKWGKIKANWASTQS